MKTYYKLVRDNIPQIIEAEGKAAKLRLLDQEEYKVALLQKLTEEAKECLEARNDPEELKKEIGDALEVISAIIVAHGFDAMEIGAMRRKRKEERGGFDKKILLETVE